MGGIVIKEDLLTKYRVVDPDSEKGTKIQGFLEKRARALVGNQINFDDTPVLFLLSDTKEPNAFFMLPSNPSEHIIHHDDYPRIIMQNLTGYPVVCITRGLLEMCVNQDQLDFVLGHELTHKIFDQKGRPVNTKGEEEIADLHALDLMLDAGADPKEALKMMQKIHDYVEEKKSKTKDEGDTNSQDRLIELFLDPHMTNENRISAIEGSLTKKAHLISTRKPTDLDKSVFDTKYLDPVSVFLESEGYDDQTPEEKLKTLVKCAEYLQKTVEPDDYFREVLEQRDAYRRQETDPKKRDKLDNDYKMLEGIFAKEKEEGYPSYYRGPVIEKKYQRRIAILAEEVIAENPDLDTSNLCIDIQNTAYKHIEAHGYPVLNDRNASEAIGILYSYFYLVFHEHSQTPEDSPNIERTRIEKDIDAAKKELLGTNTRESFIQAFERLNLLEDIQVNITSSRLGGYTNKRDDLSVKRFPKDKLYLGRSGIYPKTQAGEVVPWNAHVLLAKKHEDIKTHVQKLLKRQSIEDYRLTLGVPYVSTKGIYAIDENGIIGDQQIPKYEFDYICNKDVVHDAYDYIRGYLDDEETRGIEIAKRLSAITEDDFLKPMELSVRSAFNDASTGNQQVYEFFTMFNSMPSIYEGREHRSDRLVIESIPYEHRMQNPIPGANDRRDSSSMKGYNFIFSTDLFEFTNPIFQSHFGEEYDLEILKRKENLRDGMFEEIIPFLQRSTAIWENAKANHDRLEQPFKDLGYHDPTRLQGREKSISNDFRRYRDIEERSRRAIFDTLTSIDKGVSNDGIWHQKFTEEQKSTLARYVVQDTTGVFQRFFNSDMYESFFDYLGVMGEQINHVVKDNPSYDYTDRIKILAGQYGFTPSQTPDDFKSFVDKYTDQKDKAYASLYMWQLHAIDGIRLLQQSPTINVNSLCLSIKRIHAREASDMDDPMPKVKNERHRNYVRLMTDGNLLDLSLRAIDNPDNYKNLSRDELVETVRNLSYIEGNVDISHMKNDDASAIINRNIKSCLEAAEEKTLAQDDALEKIKYFYRVFDTKLSGFSLCEGWSNYKKEAVKRLQTFSDKEDFWPEDILEHTEALIYARESFIEEQILKDKLLNQLFDRIEAAPNTDNKTKCIQMLLDQKMRAPRPETRQRLFDLYTQDVAEKIGLDDGSQEYQELLQQELKAIENKPDRDRAESSFSRRFTPLIKKPKDLLSGKIVEVDKHALMQQLAEKIVSQEKTSYILKEACEIKLDTIGLLKSHLLGVGVDFITKEIDHDPEIASEFMSFLSSNGDKSDCEAISGYIAKKSRERTKDGQIHEKKRAEQVIEKTKPVDCELMYENFWGMPLEHRAAFIARMLKSVSKVDSDNDPREPWEKGFDIAIDKIIPKDSMSDEDQYAREVLHSNVKAHDDYERMLNLSAIMVAGRNIGEGSQNLGKALRHFLENKKDPAYFKGGQAGASQLGSEHKIGAELQSLKDQANKPARWEIYDWMKAENIPEKFWKSRQIGEIIGSASYYTTIAVDDQVLRILRPEARERAQKGFSTIQSTIEDLDRKDETSDLNFSKLTKSMGEMVAQAARMSDIETDQHIGVEQYKTAKEIGDGVILKSGRSEFSLSVMDWRAVGQNWVLMDRAKGVTFNALPDKTPQEKQYKKDVAKAYIKFEIMNILSGGKFDHDRHGGQLCIDTSTNQIGLFDTGAMAISVPSEQDQGFLGNVLYETFKKSDSGKISAADFDRVLTDKIEDLHLKGKDTQYLVEVRKGLLALGDFFKVLDKNDIGGILPNIGDLSEISPAIQEGIYENMSLVDKAKVSTAKAFTGANKGSSITIVRPNGSDIPIQVELYGGPAEKIIQSSWFEKTVTGDNSNFPPKARNLKTLC